MDEVNVKIVNKSFHRLPEYKTPGSAGMDLKANILDQYKLEPHTRCVLPTGIHIQLPEGYECQIRSRSGLAANKGIIVLNEPATIDSDYTGELKVILYNTSNEDFIIHPGDRVAQMVIAQYSRAKWNEVIELEDTERGTGGLGHTGM